MALAAAMTWCLAVAAEATEESPAETVAHSSLTTNEVQQLELAVGENRTIRAAHVKSYSVGAGGNVDVRLTPAGDNFVIVGLTAGMTTLLTLNKDGTQTTYEISVFQRRMAAVEQELQSLIGDTPGVAMRRVGARFFIEGGVSSEPELQRLERISALYPGQVESLVVLGGVAPARKINVRVDFLFVQLNRTRDMNLGVTYPATFGGAGVTRLDAAFDLTSSSFTAAQAAIVEHPLPGLDLAASNGYAKVLKRSAVLTSNGSEATFSSGGEQYFPATNGLVSTLQAIEFGTTVTVLPRFDPGSGELVVRVKASVADLTSPRSQATDLPGRNLSELDTLVTVHVGQSIVLSGIRASAARKRTAGLPGLSEIPVLGLLFGSQQEVDEEEDGIVIVTPTVIDSLEQSPKQLVQQALSGYLQFQGSKSELNQLPHGILPQP